jgi:PAS domain S-box-containing protein
MMGRQNSNINILLVDDEPVNLQILVELLGKEGYKTVFALEGKTAIEVAKKQKPDLILLDIMMPGMDGFAVCAKLKSLKETKDIPVIFISALSSAEDKVNGFKAGGLDYIPKPFEPAEVIARVNTHLSLHFSQMNLADTNKRFSQAQDELKELNAELENRIEACTVEVIQANEQFLESEEINSIIMQTAPDAIISTNENGIVISCNEAAKTMFGCGIESLNNRNISEVIPMLDKKELKRVIREKQNSRIGNTVEMFAVKPDGSEMPIEISLSYNESKDKKYYIIIIRDISNRITNEANLKRYEALLAETGRIVKIGGWEVDIVTEKMIWTDETYHIHELPLTYQPNINEGINFYHPDSLPIITTAYNNAVEKGESYDLELKFITAKNNEIWVRTQGKPILENGKVVKLYGTFQDITQQREALEKLERNERLLSETGRLAKVGGWEIDLLSNESTWTDQTCRIHEVPIGFSPNLEQSLSFYHPDSLPLIQSVVKQAIDHGTSFDEELRLITAKSNHIWVRAVGQAVMKDGKAIKLFGTFQDITVQKEADDKLKRSELLLSETGRLAKIGGWEIDIANNTSSWTDETFRIHEVPLGTDISVEDGINFYHPDDLPIIQEAVSKAFEVGTPFDEQAELQSFVTYICNFI